MRFSAKWKSDSIPEIGKRDPIEVDKIHELAKFKRDLERDCKYLKKLHDSFKEFAKQKENDKKESIAVTQDEKLNKLIAKIEEKRKRTLAERLLCFPFFFITAKYLYDQLRLNGYERIALVTGTENQCDYTSNRRARMTLSHW